MSSNAPMRAMLEMVSSKRSYSVVSARQVSHCINTSALLVLFAEVLFVDAIPSKQKLPLHAPSPSALHASSHTSSGLLQVPAQVPDSTVPFSHSQATVHSSASEQLFPSGSVSSQVEALLPDEVLLPAEVLFPAEVLLLVVLFAEALFVEAFS